MQRRLLTLSPANVVQSPIAKITAVTLLGALALAAWAQLDAPLPAKPVAPAAQHAEAPLALHPVEIRPAAAAPRVTTGRTNHHGASVTIGCAICHTTTKPNPALRRAADLRQFHFGLTYAHGELTCLSCHNAQNYDSLRLADGSPVEFADALRLCAQCHGPQMRDYQHGAHGGMTGHWDLTRGPRQRNHCLHCHDAHAPKFPVLAPVFPPRNRDPARAAAAPTQPSHP